jgi:GT2 family glycosyltransferase
MFELSQMPYEHPKYYSPLNWETPWASGACMVIKRSLFNKCHGFDSNIFMYCEDVELSFHVRMFGLSIKYLPDVAINHYSYKYPGEDKFVSRMYTPANNFYLRCKYGKAIDVYRGMKINRKFLKNVSHTERRYIKIKFIKMFFAYIGALFFRNDKNFCPKFYGYEYADSRLGSFYPIKNCSAEPLVSIIVRTHNRPKVLRETLISLRNQIYKNFEICIVEDGEDTCTKMLKDEFNDLNIRYEATKKHVGRCAAANIGMKMSKGKYLNFLDDDDFFFADHIKVLVSELESGNYNCAFSLALEERINIYDTNNYKYNITQRLPLPCKYYRQLDIFKANCFPIQSVMFKKTLLNKMIDKGNFDENIDCLEDWDFWIRMGLVDHFHFVDKVTSLYRIPAKPEDYFKRKQEINQYMNYIYKKYQDKKIAITLEQAMIMREL